nr:succinate dehydrogenase subunit 3 [Ceramothamnion sp.]WQF69686.1 succinate dehydrogenase subunit 3 [Ceramothamnion sp.]
MWYSFTFNRPISPHILIYQSSFNLLKSILHRISGLLLTLCFVFSIFLLKWTIFPTFIFQSLLNIVKLYFFISLILIIFFYHFISGLIYLFFNYN